MQEKSFFEMNLEPEEEDEAWEVAMRCGLEAPGRAEQDVLLHQEGCLLVLLASHVLCRLCVGGQGHTTRITHTSFTIFNLSKHAGNVLSGDLVDVQHGLRLPHLLQAACRQLAVADCYRAGGAGDLAGGLWLLCQVKKD